jgi:hypothetical protein
MNDHLSVVYPAAAQLNVNLPNVVQFNLTGIDMRDNVTAILGVYVRGVHSVPRSGGTPRTRLVINRVVKNKSLNRYRVHYFRRRNIHQGPHAHGRWYTFEVRIDKTMCSYFLIQ